MDAIGIFELGAKAGRAYVRAIRQAYRDAKAGEPDYHASGLGVAEEGGEALEPNAIGRCLDCDLWAFQDTLRRNHGICTDCSDDKPEARMESDGPDATQPLGPTPSDLCVCGHTLYVHWTRCDVASHYEVDDCLCSGFRLADVQQTNAQRREAFGPYETPEAFAPQVPSSSAGRGVGSPGVSAGAEEPAPPGKRTTALTFDELRAAAEYVYLWSQHPRVDDRNRAIRDLSDRLKDAAWEIRSGVGATPTPKPAEAEAASTFEQHRKTK